MNAKIIIVCFILLHISSATLAQAFSSNDFLYLATGTPSEAIDWNNRGDSLFEQGRYDQAIQAYDEALRVDPNYETARDNQVRALTAKGNSLLDQSKYDQAIQAYDEALRLDPNHKSAWNNKGNALFNQRKYDQAIQAYDEALRLDPNYALAANNRILALNRRLQPIVHYEERFSLVPKFSYKLSATTDKVKLLFTNGNDYYDAKSYDKAIISYNKAIEEGGDIPEIWYNLGNAFYKYGEYKTAITAYNNAIGSDENGFVTSKSEENKCNALRALNQRC